MAKLSTVFATAALLVAAAAPSFAGNTTAAGPSPSHHSDVDSGRNNTTHRNGTSGVSTPSDSGSAGTITNGQSALMPTSPSATRQDTDASPGVNANGDKSGEVHQPSGTGSSSPR